MFFLGDMCLHLKLSLRTTILNVISTHDLTVYALKFIKVVCFNFKIKIKNFNMCLIHKLIVRTVHSKRPDQTVPFEATDLDLN